MTLEELMKFRGKDIEAYSEAISKRNKLNRTITRLAGKKYDLEDAIDVLDGDERQALKKQELEKVEKKMLAKIKERNKLKEFISANQR